MNPVSCFFRFVQLLLIVSYMNERFLFVYFFFLLLSFDKWRVGGWLVSFFSLFCFMPICKRDMNG